MEFNDLTFVLLFLPTFVISYYLFKRSKLIITIFSMLFYLLSDLKYFWLLVLVIVITYLVALMVKENKKAYCLYILFFILLIASFKYSELLKSILTSLSIVSIVMPIGISYYLFESFSYVSDCYYGKYEADKNILNVITYISFFPTIISGPIIRYDDFKKFIETKEGNVENIGKGLRRFFIGFAKKIIIANQLFTLCSVIYAKDTILSTLLAWIGLLAYALRLYYDFSACSDMAIGIGQMIGYQMPENFDNPYNSLSVSEFFRRWHITLGTWFKDYVYIPLGGNKKGTTRQITNIMLVWFCTGLWHGSSENYLIWGLFLGTIISLEKIFIQRIKLPTIVRWLYTTFVIMIAWLIFSTNDLAIFSNYAAFLFSGIPLDFEYFLSFGVSYTLIILAMALLFMLPVVKTMCCFVDKNLPLIYDLLVITIFVISIWLIVVGNQATSIYFGF